MTEWNKELEKKILRKSRFTLTFRMLRLLLLSVLIYGAYMVILSVSTDKLHIADENNFYTKLALDWKVPNLRGTQNFEEKEITIFGTKRLSYPLVKKVGKADLVMGDAFITKKLSNTNSSIEYQHPGKEQLNDFSFSYPEDPLSGKKLLANPEPEVWETLGMLHEGTVAELAFSTSRFMDTKELIQLVEPYDVDILWLPLHTGEFETFTPGSWGGDGSNITVNTLIGLTGGRTVSEDFQSTSLITSLDAKTVEESENLMIQNIKKLLAEKPVSYYETFLGLNHLNERYKFLEENGFITYGAVVTGPVKELLKLRDVEGVQGEQLGEVELWNWENQ
ncbi:hypothetical protein L1279_001500 [Planomicrobium sp. HSC-17F08]|nr:hypothetical protein [Planomicrobium sp. HSC-17F08]